MYGLAAVIGPAFFYSAPVTCIVCKALVSINQQYGVSFIPMGRFFFRRITTMFFVEIYTYLRFSCLDRRGLFPPFLITVCHSLLLSPSRLPFPSGLLLLRHATRRWRPTVQWWFSSSSFSHQDLRHFLEQRRLNGFSLMVFIKLFHSQRPPLLPRANQVESRLDHQGPTVWYTPKTRRISWPLSNIGSSRRLTEEGWCYQKAPCR